MKSEKLLTYGLFGVLLGAAAYLGYTLLVSHSTPRVVPQISSTTPNPAPSSPDTFSIGNAIDPVIKLSPIETSGSAFIDPTASSNNFGVKYTLPNG
ncbi:MAG: hypothetical protein IVW51_11080 [Thermaceae bacterium]|nr:hypothetical protein [Thermaceae bacterium]